MTADGQPTTDPQQIYHGAVMLPFGAHKGYGLAVLVELLAGVLANASILSEVHSWNMQPGRDSGTGHFFMTINPEFFGGRQRCVERAEQMITELLSAPKAPGVERIYYPGEIEFEKEARALREGLDLPDESYSELLRAQKLL